MKRLLTISVAGFGLMLAVSAQAQAQAYPYYQRPLDRYPQQPALSPYLNLGRGGNPAINYYLGTLPELDRRANALNVGGTLLGIDRRLQAQEIEGLSAPVYQTGHPTYFSNYGAYYNFGLLRPQSSGGQPAPPATRGASRTGK